MVSSMTELISESVSEKNDYRERFLSVYNIWMDISVLTELLSRMMSDLHLIRFLHMMTFLNRRFGLWSYDLEERILE